MRFALAGLAVIGFVACGSTTGGTTAGSGTTGEATTTGGDTGGGTTTGGTTGSTGPVLDARDGQTYPTVVIGAQTWLAANMNYDTDGGVSWCYGQTASNCDTYGRLYTYAAAQTACPAGWHLGSDAEWKTLETTLGMASGELTKSGENTPRGTNQGTQLKEGGGSGFDAKLGGYGSGLSNPTFLYLAGEGYFWTSTPDGSQIWRRHISSGAPYLFRFENPPSSFAISVRCVMDSGN